MKLQDKIVKWLQNKVKKANAEGLILGLSGGIDSAVVSRLSQIAFPNNHLCIIMPCKSEPEDKVFAQQLTNKFDLNYIERDLTDIFYDFIETNTEREKGVSSVAFANVKARLRTITLYFYANVYNYLVVGTSNKSELMMGYFTKYGDGGVDLEPLGNLLKSRVYLLAKDLGISQEIIDRPPSAGLWIGQTDEQEMGITYKDLDNILRGKIKGIDKKLITKVKRWGKMSEHKRKTPPIFKGG